MTTLYLIRHGQSISNAQGICAGHADYDLSELGVAQAAAAAEVLCKQPITAVYSSDLKRAYHTARATADRLGLTVTTDIDLRELHAGLWENVPNKEIKVRYADSHKRWVADPEHYRLPEGESVSQVRERMTKAILSIAMRHDGEHVLIASHASALRMFFSGVRGTDFSHSDPDLFNTAISTVTYENGHFSIVDFGNTDHLDEHQRPRQNFDGFVLHT